MIRGTRLLAPALLLATATAMAGETVVIGSKNFEESRLLAEIFAQLIEQRTGLTVERRFNLAGTQVCLEALRGGAIDIYPEYTGNAAFFFDKADSEIWRDAAAGYEEAAKLDAEANDIVWLTPAPANNTWAIAVSRDVAEANGLSSMSDLGKFITEGGEVKLAASSEFVNSAAALPAFQAAYGFEMGADHLLILSGGDTAATIRAAAEKIDGTNAAMVYGTDGAISEVGLQVMEDDKSVQPVYAPTAIIRREALDEAPQIAELLKPVFEGLDLETLQGLNARIQLGGESAGAVAEDYLKQAGLID